MICIDCEIALKRTVPGEPKLRKGFLWKQYELQSQEKILRVTLPGAGIILLKIEKWL